MLVMEKEHVQKKEYVFAYQGLRVVIAVNKHVYLKPAVDMVLVAN